MTQVDAIAVARREAQRRGFPHYVCEVTRSNTPPTWEACSMPRGDGPTFLVTADGGLKPVYE
jgi:hypothetical protein